jgi:hypothetical protein
MEFLQINGSAKLDVGKLDEAFCRLVHRIQGIAFEGDGVLLVIYKDDELTIEGSGVVQDIYSVNELFRQLNGYLAVNSYLTINRARWECYVQLNTVYSNTPQREKWSDELTLVDA